VSRLTDDVLGGDPLLTPQEVAALMRVEASTVNRWAAAGRFPDTPDGLPGVVKTLGGREQRIRTSVVRGLLDGSLQPREVGDDGRD
jgi:hypothetical protein